MHPAELSRIANLHAESICRHLLPNGKRIHHEWCVGDLFGSEGRSLKIALEGSKIGVWSDFATGDTGGDLLDLWQETQRCSLREAVAQMSSFLHIVYDGKETRPKRSYERPDKARIVKEVKRLNKQGRVYTYLKSRGLTDQALDEFRISEEKEEWMVFPYLREDGCINIKYIHIERDENNKKRCRQMNNAEPCLFGWLALENKYPSTREVTICEGEIDCITLHQCGIPTLSVPNGGGGGRKQDWIENDFDRLSNFDTIYLCMDSDQAGKEAENEIVRRLGNERIRLVQLPYKDANECLKHNIIDFRYYLRSARSLDPSELKPADYFTDQVLDKFYPSEGSYRGMRTPWKKVNEALKFDRAELIIWTGFSGSGKSLILNQIAAQGMLDNEKFVICSMEMPGKVTLWRMTRQLTGQEKPTRERINHTMKWMSDKLWILNIIGTGKVDRILEVFKYAVKRYDIRNFIIDSLTKCNIAEDDYNGQKEFIDKLTDFATQYQVIIHLVVHQRKPMNEDGRPGKFGVRGAAAITDEASTVISLWRRNEEEETNKRKKKVVEIDPPNAVLSIVKNRETGIEGKFGLYFDIESLQYREEKEETRIDYLSFPQEESIAVF